MPTSTKLSIAADDYDFRQTRSVIQCDILHAKQFIARAENIISCYSPEETTWRVVEIRRDPSNNFTITLPECGYDLTFEDISDLAAFTFRNQLEARFIQTSATAPVTTILDDIINEFDGD